jgi:hypothetical protein
MSQSAPDDELARLETKMRELLAKSETIQQRITKLQDDAPGVVDDSVLIKGAEITAQDGDRDTPAKS